jgi:hypothetical protein
MSVVTERRHEVELAAPGGADSLEGLTSGNGARRFPVQGRSFPHVLLDPGNAR